MSAPEKSSPNENTYFIEAENAAEMARLISQDRLITRVMNELLPGDVNPTTVRRVLDVACGPGSWVLDVASAYPYCTVTGVDISSLMIAYSQSQAEVQELNNAHFKVMDVLKPWEFADNTFDIVNARFISSFVPIAAWANLVQECTRVLRPGGILRLTESESLVSNSPAHEKLMGIGMQSMRIAGQSFSPDGRSMGITPMLRRLLGNAQFVDIKHRSHAIDYSKGAKDHLAMYQDLMVMMKLIQPFLIKCGLTTQWELDGLYQRMLAEMMEEDFCALMYFLSVWGRKPKE